MKRYLVVVMKTEILGRFDDVDEARETAKAYLGENGCPSDLTIAADLEGVVEGWENTDGTKEAIVLDMVADPQDCRTGDPVIVPFRR